MLTHTNAPTATELLDDPVLHLLLEQDGTAYEGHRDLLERLREQRLGEAGFEAV